MTTLNEAREAVYQRFVDNFTGVAASRITFDSEDFDPPSTGSWVRLAVRSVGRTQRTLGRETNRKFRSQAVVFVQIFSEANAGTQSADALAKEAADIYEGVRFSGLAFQVASVREAGPDKRWYQMVVEADFDYDETK